MGLPLRLVALAVLVPGASGQSSESFLLNDDVQFAENLARYRYFDLAFDVLGEVASRKLDTQASGTVAFTEARILRRASESTADEARQLEFLTQAIDKLADWARPGSVFVYHERRTDALADLASLLQARGQLRAHMLKAAEGSQQETLQSLAEADFQHADEVLVALQREYVALAEAASAAGKTDSAALLAEKGALTLYSRGLNSLQWSEVAKDPEFRLEEARQALIDYQWELEEEKIWQYFALHYQGVVMRKLGKADDALELQREVLEQAQYWWDNYLDSPDPAAAATIAELFDRTWGEIAAVQADQGDIDAADATIDTMLSRHGKAQLAFGRPGWQVLLDWAERVAQLGRRTRASTLVKQVADGAANLPEGERARDMLASMLTSGGSGGADVPTSVLMAAAKGLFDRREFTEAHYAYELAAASIRTPDESRDFGLPAWLGAGRSLASQQRYLEAALACERALEAAIAAGLDIDTQASVAMEMYGHFDRRAKETGDAFDKQLKAQAIERVTALGVGLDLPFYEARDRFETAEQASPQDPKLYDAALADFRNVSPNANNHERALVYVARCHQGAGRLDDAQRAYDVMLQRAADPAQAPANAQARTRREIALGEALYYKADLLLSDAVGRPADALAMLERVEDRLPSQPSFVESGKYQRVVAYTLLGELDKAAAAVEDLAAFRPDSALLRSAWFKLSAALLAASEKATQAGDSMELLVRAADALWSSAELAGFPSFTNILNTGDWYTRAGRFDNASRSYQKALEVYDKPGSSVTAAQLDQARLGLARSLTSQREFARARPYWKDLLTRAPRNQQILSGAARCYGGWLEKAPDGSIVEVAGSGDYDEAHKLWTDIAAHLPASSRYQHDWWEARLGRTYTKYREAAIHPAVMNEARTILESIAAVFPDYDGPPPDETAAEQAPEPPFRPLFRYLEQKIRP